MKERQDRILEMIRDNVTRQVGLREQDMATSVVAVPNPYNNNLDDLEDVDDIERSMLPQSRLLHARTYNQRSQSLVRPGNHDIRFMGDQSEVR